MSVERDNDITIAEMREMREMSSVLYKKFSESREFFATHAFCFYEGEDGKYYNSRIEKYWGNSFIPMVAGNKKEVIKAMKKITSDPTYDDVCTMFFVDRDYDESLRETNSHLFETPCYSIENLYAQESSLDKILRAEFGLNITDSDYHKCKAVYRLRLAEFNNIIMRFNAIVKYQHQYAPNICCRFSSIKTSHLARISIDQVSQAARHDEQISLLIEKLNADVTIIDGIEAELRLESNLDNILRGKNQLDLFVGMIAGFRDANNQGAFFSQKLENVHINISVNRLSELSQYAITPPELNEFLSRHAPSANTLPMCLA